MKKIIFSLIALLTIASAPLFAQSSTPTKEFTVSVTETNISLKPGETKTVDVFVNRSKRFEKTNIDLSLSTSLPAGVEVSFERAAEANQADKMIIKAAGNVAPYKGTYVLNAKSSTLTKGTMFTLVVGGENSLPAGE